jgi:hypothetical protein
MPSYTVIGSSNPSAGALDTNAAGNAFKMSFREQLPLPAKRDIRVGVSSATFWNTMPNIIAGENDTLVVTTPRDSDGVDVAYPIQLAPGLYAVEDLNTAITEALISAGARVSAGSPIELRPEYPTGLTKVVYNYVTTELDLTAADSIADLIGWARASYGPHIVGYVEKGTAIAQMNSVNSVHISSDVVSGGLPTNGSYENVAAKINITADVGSQQVFEPRRGAYSPASSNKIQNIRFAITDENNIPITMSEYWTVELRFEWD